jgi:Putative adhesin
MPTFDTSGPILALIDVATATVRINADDRADTVVEIRPSDQHNDADVEAAEHTRAEYADGRLLVRTDRDHADLASGSGLSLGKLVESPSSWARTLLLGPGSVTVTIDLPAGSRVDAKTAGSLRCRGPLGEVTASTSHGDIRIEQAARLRLRSTYGDISVTRASGPAEVTTTHGGINLGEIDGAAAVKTSHGHVRLGEVTGELRLNSAHGDITVERALSGVAAKTAYASVQIDEVVSGSVVMETTGGGLDLGIREGTAAWLDVSSRYGTVDVSLDPGDGPGETEPIVEVRAHTTHGDIAIHRS